MIVIIYHDKNADDNDDEDDDDNENDEILQICDRKWDVQWIMISAARDDLDDAVDGDGDDDDANGDPDDDDGDLDDDVDGEEDGEIQVGSLV